MATPMHPHLKSLLVKAGCDPTASDGDAQKFMDGMSGDKKDQITGQLAEMMDGDAGGGGESAAPGALAATPAIASPATAATALIRTVTAPGPTAPQDEGDAVIARETKRVAQLRSLAALIKVPDDVLNIQIANPAATAAIARTAFLSHLETQYKPLNSVRVGSDKAIDSLVTAMPQALVMRAGLSRKTMEAHGEKVHERAPQLAGLTLLDMYRVYLGALGFSGVQEFSRVKLADCLGPRGLRKEFPRMAALAESTSDFSNITLDAINKTLRFNYLDAKRTWPQWAERKTNSDFKNINRVVLSEAPNMVAASEGAEINYVMLGDSKEVYVLSTFKAGIRLTRNAIINDDMDAFNAIPRLQANSAARKEDDVAYLVLTGNPVMADGNALYSTAHANYVASGSGSAPSISSLQVASTAIKKQKGLAGAARLELEPKYLMVATSIEEQTKELLGSKTLVVSQSSSGSAPVTVGDSNPYYNRYTVIGSTRMDDANPTGWHLWSDFRDGQVNTVEVCFLTDEPEPVLKQETDFDTDDVKYLVRHNVAAKAIDFRGGFFNYGR